MNKHNTLEQARAALATLLPLRTGHASKHAAGKQAAKGATTQRRNRQRAAKRARKAARYAMIALGALYGYAMSGCVDAQRISGPSLPACAPGYAPAATLYATIDYSYAIVAQDSVSVWACEQHAIQMES